jgi:hypothetical protein
MNFFPHPNDINANTTEDWYSSDQPYNYKEDKNLYKFDDFKYIFNSDGFRCDDLDQESEIPILFLGCSITEGVGLPIHETWSYKLLEKIKNKTKKNIKYWNLAKSGASIDTNARHLFWFCEKYNVKHVFICVPGIYRREFGWQDSNNKFLRLSGPWWEWENWKSMPGDNLKKQVYHDDAFAQYETFRSFMIIESIRKYKNFTVDVTFMDSIVLSSFYKKYNFQNYFENINFIECDIKKPKKNARDLIHYGPEFHNKFVEIYWKHAIRYF